MRMGRIWANIIGKQSDFPMEIRIFNAYSFIGIFLLILFFASNVYLGLNAASILLGLGICIQVVLYYMSRFTVYHSLSIAVQGIFSYLLIGINYFFNDGSQGPSLLLFFLSYNLLITVTPKRQHIIWTSLHVLIPVMLIFIERSHPEWMLSSYQNKEEYLMDILFCYVVTLTSIYFIADFLRDSYFYEKTLARIRKGAIERQKLQLDQSESNRRSFFHSFKDSHIFIGTDYNILDFNYRAQQIIYQSYNKIPKVSESILTYIPGPAQQEFKEAYSRALRGEYLHFRHHAFYMEEKAAWWNIRFQPIHDDFRRITGVSFNASNITREVEKEQAINKRNEVLLQIAHIQSHELRGPVASILGITQMVRDGDYLPDREVLLLLEKEARSLDNKIHEIVHLANKINRKEA